MNKKDLSERDICSKFIGPTVKRAGWDGMMQFREEVAFTKRRIIVRGKLVTRGEAKRADYILYYKLNIPIAIIEAKDNNHGVGDRMQQLDTYTQEDSDETRAARIPERSGNEQHGQLKVVGSVVGWSFRCHVR
jgi:type I restriction enzyme R subunit